MAAAGFLSVLNFCGLFVEMDRYEILSCPKHQWTL